MNKIKKIPYGISDFKQLIRENKYYVDKTQFIPKLEDAGNFLFLVRPRRFGKSMFLSMLSAYYDLNEKDKFDTLFDGLWIKDNPTELRNTFEVLRLDFSQIGGTIDELKKNFDNYVGVVIDGFAERYAYRYPDGFADKVKSIDNTDMKLNYINEAASHGDHYRYLIIDEYDNFTNTVLNERGENVYRALTHGEGFYRDVFKKFKGNYDRILMIGVSPVTMDDVTSGYNIATNITMNPVFNQVLGFSEEDVRQMIRYYRDAGVLSWDEERMIAEMKPWYDNYCFAKSVVNTDPKMFNSDMVLYFVRSVIQTGQAPEQMIDPNTRTDYNKMHKLIRLDKLDGNRRGILNQIADEGYIYGQIVESFPARFLTIPENFVSLLFYYGMLTIGGVRGVRQRLVIPNNNVRKQYYGYLLEQYQEIAYIDVSRLSDSFDLAALDGEWRPMIDWIASAYEKTTSVRQLIEGEHNLQGFMNAYLSLSPYYLIAPEMEMSHGFCDFFLMPDMSRYPMIRHSYILELKYLKADATEQEAAEQWDAAVEQIRGYAKASMVEKLTAGTTLHLLVVQIKGYELLRAEETTAAQL